MRRFPAIAWLALLAVLAILAVVLLLKYSGGHEPGRDAAGGRAAGGNVPAVQSTAGADDTVTSEQRRTARAAAGLDPALPPPSRETSEDELRGIVLDPEGRGLAGAEVLVSHAPSASFGTLDLEYRRQRREVASGRTDARGEFRFHLEPGPPYELDVRAAGLQAPRLLDRHPGEYLEIRMSPAASLAGRVTRAADGQAATGVPVRLFRSGGHRENYTTRTDAEGVYRFAELAAGAWMLELQPESLQPPRWTEVRLDAGAETRRDFALADGEPILGQVLDARTQLPIAGAEVSESWTFDRTTLSGPDGRFRLEGAGREGYRELSVRAAGYGRIELSLERHAERPVQVRIELAPAHGAIGRIVSPQGEPRPGVYVAAAASGYADDIQSIDWQAARTGADGRFELGGLRADVHHVLFVRHEGCATLVYEFPYGKGWSDEAAPVVDLGDIVLPDGGRIGGVVEDESGAPVPDVEVTVYGNNADRDRRGPLDQDVNYYVSTRTGRTDTRGRFLFSDLAGGQFRVSIEIPGRSELPAQTVDLAVGEQRSDLRFVLPGGLEIAGVILTPDGRPPDVVYVELTQEGEHAEPVEVSQQAQKDGSFRFAGLPAGSFRLACYPYDWGNEDPPRRPVVPQYRNGIAAGTTDVKVVLPWGATVRGTLYDRDGKPAAGVTVYAETAGDWLQSARTDAEGAFELTVEDGTVVDLVARFEDAQVRAQEELGYAGGGSDSGPAPETVEVRVLGVAAGSSGVVIRRP